MISISRGDESCSVVNPSDTILLIHNLNPIDMKKDYEIQKNVMDELKSIPLFNANEIGVAVKNGVVTLSGIVNSYPEKIKAERTARKVANIRGIAEDIIVRLSAEDKKSDPEIAQ